MTAGPSRRHQATAPRQVACAILRQRGRVLAFRHPLVGGQLVKGGIAPGETAEAAALRELAEEAGVTGRDAQLLDVVPLAETWHLVALNADPLPESWVHACADDGGHAFAFFWTDRPSDLVPPHRTILEHVL